MTSVRNIVSILILSAFLTLSQVQQSSGYANQNQIRIRRQVVEESVQENDILQDQDQENNIQQNEDQGDARQENNVQDAIQQNVGEEDAEQENNEQVNDGLEKEKAEDADTNIEEENVTEDIVEETTPTVTYPLWTTCDFGIEPIKSCYDCNKLLICKRVGGIVKPCRNPFRPNCNNGTCTPVPSAECV